MNAQILVCCHKPDIMVTIPPYMPIQVGSALASALLPIAGDDTGDNISHKNPSYCELTGVYWAWKNLSNTDIVGICHYRRYFDFHHQVGFPHAFLSEDQFDNTDFSIPQKVLKSVSKGRIVVACARYLRESVEENYCFSHESSDYRVLRSIVEEDEPANVQRAWRRVMHRGVKFHPYNMFIMRRADFEDYCSWLFPLLEKVEVRLKNTDARDTYQRRVFGFMAERLLGVWIAANGKRTIERPVICFNNLSTGKKANQGYLLYKASGWLKKVGLTLLRI